MLAVCLSDVTSNRIEFNQDLQLSCQKRKTHLFGKAFRNSENNYSDKYR